MLRFLMLIAAMFMSPYGFGVVKEAKTCTREIPGFIVRDKGSKERFQGLSFQFISEVYKTLGTEPDIEITSWERCLSLLSSKHGGWMFAPLATYNQKNARKYYYTRPFVTLHWYFFYLKKKFSDKAPGGPDTGKICARKVDEPETGNRNYVAMDADFRQLLSRLKEGSCDFVVGRGLDIGMEAGTQGYSLFDDPLVGNSLLPGLDPERRHILINKNAPWAKKIRKIVNQKISQVWKDGSIDRWKTAHFEKDARYLQRPQWVK